MEFIAMKRYVFGLLGLALLQGATALAQERLPRGPVDGYVLTAALPDGPAAALPAPTIQPAPPPPGAPLPGGPGVIVMPGAPAPVGGDCCHHGHGRACCAPHQCVPEHYIKVTKKVVFT